MNEFLLIKFLHLLGFAYWIGADLGVFYTSYYVANDKLSGDVRVATARILFALDQVPRMCMTMMLPLGLHLTWRMGLLRIDAAIMSAIWAAALLWLGMVVYLHSGKSAKTKAFLTSFDFWFRLALALSLIGTAVLSLASGFGSLPYWLAIKLLIFGALVGSGLIIRIKLRPFGAAFAAIASGNASDADNEAIRKSLGSTRPFVVAIWIGLLAAAALGLHLI